MGDRQLKLCLIFVVGFVFFQIPSTSKADDESDAIYFSEEKGDIPWLEIPLYRETRQYEPYTGGTTTSTWLEGTTQKKYFVYNHPLNLSEHNNREAHHGFVATLNKRGGRYHYPVWDFRRESVYRDLCLKHKVPGCELVYHLERGYDEYRKLKKSGDLTELKIDDIIRRSRFHDDNRIPRLESAKWLIQGIPDFIATNPGPLFSVEELLTPAGVIRSCQEWGTSICVGVVDYKLRLYLSLEKVAMLNPRGDNIESVGKAREFSEKMSNVLASIQRLQSSLKDYNLKAEVFALGHTLFETPEDLNDWGEVLQKDSVLLSGGAQSIVGDLLTLINNYPDLEEGFSYLVAFSVENPLRRILYRLFTEPNREFDDLTVVLFHNAQRVKLHADFIYGERQRVWGNQ